MPKKGTKKTTSLNPNCFNEHEMAKAYFEFSDKPLRSVVNSLIEKQIVVELFKMVSKYLYNDFHLNVQDILEYLRRYSVVISYYFTSSLNNEALYNEDLEEMLKHPLSIKSLKPTISGKGLYPLWYNKERDKKTYNSKFEAFFDSEDSALKSKIYKLSRIASFENNFFSLGTDLSNFAKKDRIKRFDMILSEAIADNYYVNFDFKIEPEEMPNFLLNVIEPNSNNIIYSYVLMGYIAYDLISNDNLDMKKAIHFPKSSKLRMMSIMRKASYKLKFVSKEDNEIKIDLIKPFSFKLNSKTYVINNTGIH